MDAAVIKYPNGEVDYQKLFTYTVNDTSTLIIKYIGAEKDVVVPNKIEGRPVVVKASTNGLSGVFTNNRSINSVTFRSGVTIESGNMSNMFVNCLGLNSVYNIPDNVTNMSWTFWGCYNLSEPPVLPANLQNMYWTFRSCRNLPASPEIPESVTNMVGTFYGCENRFTTAPVIPNSVTDLSQTFRWCHNLNVASMPKLHNNITSLFFTFANTWIKKAPEIPESVTNMTGTFASCGYLTAPPSIPINVTDMRQTFHSCVRLTSVPKIPENVTNMEGTFQYCRNLTTAPNIPENVTTMKQTFYNCTNLSGDIIVHTNRINNTSMENCFYNTSLSKNVYIPITGLDATNNTWNAAMDETYGINGKNGVNVFDINTYSG